MANFPSRHPAATRAQHTTVFLIDGATGQLLRTFYDFDGELAALSSLGNAALGALRCAAAPRHAAPAKAGWAWATLQLCAASARLAAGQGRHS